MQASSSLGEKDEQNGASVPLAVVVAGGEVEKVDPAAGTGLLDSATRDEGHMRRRRHKLQSASRRRCRQRIRRERALRQRRRHCCSAEFG